MPLSRCHRSDRPLRSVVATPRRNVWLTHRSLDLLLIAGSTCLLTLMSQPIATALTQR